MYILASQSPRRKQLMKEDISSSFKVVVSEYNEQYPSYLKTPKKIVKYIGFKKGEIVHNKYINDIVISADTIVVLDKRIIGKPKDEKDAFSMLNLLSNRKHIVYTGYAIFYKDQVINKVVKSKVKFNKLSEQLILDYIATGSPMDKAGGYGVQDSEKFNIIKKVYGSIKNVIGFPTEQIKKDLSKIK